MAISDDIADRQRKVLELLRQGASPNDIRIKKGRVVAEDPNGPKKHKRQYKKRGNLLGTKHVHFITKTPPITAKYVEVACGKIIVVRAFRTEDRNLVTCDACKAILTDL